MRGEGAMTASSRSGTARARASTAPATCSATPIWRALAAWRRARADGRRPHRRILHRRASVRIPLRRRDDPDPQPGGRAGGPRLRPLGFALSRFSGLWIWMDAVSDYMWTMRVTPVSPSKTIIELAWLVDKNAVKANITHSITLPSFGKLRQADWELCENNFAGIESSHYQPGPYAPIEIDVVKFVDWYLDRYSGVGYSRHHQHHKHSDHHYDHRYLYVVFGAPLRIARIASSMAARSSRVSGRSSRRRVSAPAGDDLPHGRRYAGAGA